jgi:hypothetical protein
VSRSARLEFRRSSYCSVGTCVEVAVDPAGGVVVRDSKMADGPQLSFTKSEWVAFLRGVRAGEFDMVLD